MNHHFYNVITISIMKFPFSKTCFNEMCILFSQIYMDYFLHLYNFHFDCSLFEHNHMP